MCSSIIVQFSGIPVGYRSTSTTDEQETDMADDVDLTKRLPRGAIPSPRSELAAAMPHVPDPKISVPPSFLMWPVQMSSWNNYTYGDCVSAEEAFAKATAAPQPFIPTTTLVPCASPHASLTGPTPTPC